jgi:hypothetical protein
VLLKVILFDVCFEYSFLKVQWEVDNKFYNAKREREMKFKSWQQRAMR